MAFFWGAATVVLAAKTERLRVAETALLELALEKVRQLSDSVGSSSSSGESMKIPVVRTVDTRIPVSTVPFTNRTDNPRPIVGSTAACEGRLQEVGVDDDCYVIHGIEVTSTSKNDRSAGKDEKPLVLLHGYMNGGAYFYRNLMGLSRYFPKIYALDQLGWGLSSRPSFQAPKTNSEAESVKAAEDFFVESLEAWRKENKIESMILAGHSMGGYLSVAYSERYPQHVDRLILISPMGVPEETPEVLKEREKRYSGWRYRMFQGFFHGLFPHYTAGDLLRSLPEKKGRDWIGQYISRRLPAITDGDEQQKLADYLYLNNALPGSGEYCLPKLLKPSVFGRHPLQHRIPALKVKSCSFLYGESDWMDINGGLFVEQACTQQRLLGQKAPDIDVYQVSRAGHLLMLDNYEEFNNGVVMAVGDVHKLVEDAPRPSKLRPDQRHVVVAREESVPEAEAVF